jgi:OHCU decarboxylase
MITTPNENHQNRPSAMPQAEFLEKFGGVYEHSYWIAKTIYATGLTRGHDTVRGLHGAFKQIVDAADPECKLALLRAHPDLAGKLAVAGELTPESAAEQNSAHLDQCTMAELQEFQSLNGRYTSSFGFPYIFAVRGRKRQEILQNFRSRVANSPDIEFAEAIKQVHKIALFRIETIFQEI